MLLTPHLGDDGKSIDLNSEQRQGGSTRQTTKPTMNFPKVKFVDNCDRDHSLPNPVLLSSASANWQELQLSYSRQPAWYVPLHTSSHHTLCISTSDPIPAERTVDGQVQTVDTLPTGDFGLYPAHLRQSFQSYQEAEAILLFLDPNLLNRTATELSFKDGMVLEPKLTPGVDPLIQHIAIALKTSLEIDGTTTQLYADAMANALSIHLLTRYSTHRTTLKYPQGGLSQQQLKQVLDCIHDALAQEVSLAELASLVQLSPYHFSRLFKQSIGVAPHQYHIRCRIDRAKQLLLERQLSLAAIALTVGFSSQAHLNYHFKRWVGATPMAFLRER
jgi:AraC family transcriptional regulator